MAKENKAATGGHHSYLAEAITQDEQGRGWLKEQIFEEGPPHKQVQHALVLERLEVLLNQIEANTGKVFEPIAGDVIELAKHDHSLVLPIGFPDISLAGLSTSSSLEKLTKGPDHEVAYTALLLQAIEWMIANSGGDK